MSANKRTNKLNMEQVLVAYCVGGATDQAFAQGVALVNNTTSLGLSDGQLGVLSWDRRGTVPFGTFLSDGVLSTDVRAIKVLQGTPASGDLTSVDPWEIGDKGYMESGVIRRDNVRSVTVQKCRPKSLANVAVTGINATPKDEKAYSFFAALDSVRMLKDYGYNGNQVQGGFTTPCYTELSITSPQDHMIQNLLDNFNKQSSLAGGNQPVVALAINTGGGSGTALGTIACGDSIDFLTTTTDFPGGPSVSTTYSLTVDHAMVYSLACLVAEQAAASGPINASSTIEVIDLSTAGNAANVNAFVVIALEEDLAKGVDQVPQTIPQVSVNLQGGFRVAGQKPSTTACRGNEGINSGREWKIMMDERHQRNIHSIYVDSDRGSVYQSGGINYLDETKSYTSIIIDYDDVEETLSTTEKNPKRLVILTGCAVTCTDVATATAIITANKAVTIPNKSDVFPTVETACCPFEVAAPLLAGDFAAILLTWLADTDAKFNNGVEFADYYFEGAKSAMFTAAGI